MDISQYIETMKNLPERFSNLAFWRGVRKLRDEVVNAFEYLDRWGNNIEHRISMRKAINYTKCNRVTAFDEVTQVGFHVIEDINNDVVIIMFEPPVATLNNIPTDFGLAIGIEYIVEMETNDGAGSVNTILMPVEIIKTPTGQNTYGFLLNTNATCAVAIDKHNIRDWKKPYKATVTRGTLVYYPSF